MGDEIQDSNVIRLTYESPFWYARLGPQPGGLEVKSWNPNLAVKELADELQRTFWVFDPAWRPDPQKMHQ
jgi:hypothetical protein